MITSFTFHYELIITLAFLLLLQLSGIFTFHYELIITQESNARTRKGRRFTFHYELIITLLNAVWDKAGA